MKYLMPEEQKRLLKTLRDSKTATRDYMIIDLVLHTGLRLQEVRMLNVGDVSDGYSVKKYLTVRKEVAKRGKEREIYLTNVISGHLRAVLRWKRERGDSMGLGAPLFVSQKHARIGKRSLQDMLEKWFKKANLEGYTFHSLRHTFAMNLRRRGNDLERIQKLLGHASLQATGIYLEPSKEDLIEAMESLDEGEYHYRKTAPNRKKCGFQESLH